jgi:SNF2 family DNA or RNA helicase
MNPLTSKFVSPLLTNNSSGQPYKTPFQQKAEKSLLYMGSRNGCIFPSGITVGKHSQKSENSLELSTTEEKKEASSHFDNISQLKPKENQSQIKLPNSPENPSKSPNLIKPEEKNQISTNPSISPSNPLKKKDFNFPKPLKPDFPTEEKHSKSDCHSPVNKLKPEEKENQKTEPVLKPSAGVFLNNERKFDELYYEVIYSGTNRKKTKSEDGILILSLKKLLLLDDKGNKLSESPNKLNATSLRPGDVLTMGNNRKVEVLSKISRADYMSGRCFMQHSLVEAAKPELVQKPLKVFEVPQGAFLLDEENQVFVDPALAEKLRPHQKEGVKFMYECLAGKRIEECYGCILADSMGLGKSLQAVSLLYTLLRKDAPYKTYARKGIIVAPATLVGNWKQEVTKWLGPTRLCPVVCVGNGKEKENLLKIFEQGMSSLLIISYDTFVKHANSLGRVCQIVICDEGHILKNCITRKNTSISSLSCRRRILLTGTPLQNNLTEFYACVSLVNPGVLGDLSTFNKVYASPILKAQEPQSSLSIREVAQARSKELWRVTELFILRRTGSILEALLPPRNEYLIFSPPSPLQTLIYEKFLSSKSANMVLETGNNSFALSICLLLRKLVNHPDLVYRTSGKSEETKELLSIAEKCKPENYYKNSDRFMHSNKFRFTQEVLLRARERSEKVVIVSSFTKTLDLLEEFCEVLGSGVFRLDGSTPASRRMQIVNEFSSVFGHFVFLLSSKAGGCGLNLVAANRLILFDADWNPSNDKQAMGRVWRDGQKLPVHIYRLFLSGTIEEKIYQRQTVKENLSSTVVDAKEGVSKFSRDDIREIFKLFPKCTTFDKGDVFEDSGSFLNMPLEFVEVAKRALGQTELVKEEPMDFTEAKQDVPDGVGQWIWEEDRAEKKTKDM